MVAVGHLDMEGQEAQKRGALRMQPRSLKFRLLAISLAWLAFSLLATGAVLVLLLSAHMQRHFDHAAKPSGRAYRGRERRCGRVVQPDWEPADPRFRKPLSGWYWEIRSGNETLKRSPSLAGRSIPAVTTRNPTFSIMSPVLARCGLDHRPGYRFARIEPALVRACGRALRHGSERCADLHGPARRGAHHAWPDAWRALRRR